jgi:signal transduction histidine kinase
MGQEDRTAFVKRLSFRTRLFAILTLFALLPATLLAVAVGITAWQALPQVSAGQAWERVAATGRAAADVLRDASLSDNQRALLSAHERELASSVTQARRLEFVVARAATLTAVIVVALLGVLWLAASRVAGHLSRQLSRPIDELVEWAAMIEKDQALPPAVARGAPEFGVLRNRVRAMSHELASSRARSREAERAIAFRETARRVAHELKNPLTPMQFAIAQIKRGLADSGAVREPLRVLEEETARLERMARSFSQFGRLPEGPRSAVDVGDLVSRAAQTAVPSGVDVRLEIDEQTPEVLGRFDALERAVVNVVVNAVEACGPDARIALRARPGALADQPAAVIEVEDNGCGIAPERLADVWEPYVTDKVQGTGLGLAIARQTVLDHAGQVSVDSARGRGTTIRFTLPAAPPPNA